MVSAACLLALCLPDMRCPLRSAPVPFGVTCRPSCLSAQSYGMLCRFIESGGVFKLVFGPKAFIVISDPVVVRYLLKVTANYPKP